MITVLGATGFIGSNIVELLQRGNIEHYAPARNEILTGKKLGHVIYCIGLTADFRSRPFDTVEAHVCALAQILQHGDFESLTYLSSARVYINCNQSLVNEYAVIPVHPFDRDELYTLTKLTGERLCLSSGKKTKIVRLSNAYGKNMNPDNFLQQVLKTITTEKVLSLQASLSSAKDYIHIEDAAALIIKIATIGREAAYNVGSGTNTSNEEIINEFKRHFDFSLDVSNIGKEIIFPELDINRIKNEFNYVPKNILKDIHLINTA